MAFAKLLSVQVTGSYGLPVIAAATLKLAQGTPAPAAGLRKPGRALCALVAPPVTCRIKRQRLGWLRTGHFIGNAQDLSRGTG